MAIPFFFIGHWYLSLFAQSFFLHRYSAHGMFTLSKFWERLFFLFTYCVQGSSFLNPRAYAILHRLHHVHSDTEDDPHSPVHHPNIFKMMLRTKDLYVGYFFNKLRASKEVLQGYTPTLGRKFENFAEGYKSRLLWGAGYVLFYFFFATSWWWYLLLPLHFIMGPLHGAIVNWFGHKVGYRNFNNRDNSRNTMAMDVIMMGELFQNNHHKFPLRLNFARRWFEFDPTYAIIRLFNLLGILKLQRIRSVVNAHYEPVPEQAPPAELEALPAHR